MPWLELFRVAKFLLKSLTPEEQNTHVRLNPFIQRESVGNIFQLPVLIPSPLFLSENTTIYSGFWLEIDCQVKGAWGWDVYSSSSLPVGAAGRLCSIRRTPAPVGMPFSYSPLNLVTVSFPPLPCLGLRRKPCYYSAQDNSSSLVDLS